MRRDEGLRAFCSTLVFMSLLGFLGFVDPSFLASEHVVEVVVKREGGDDQFNLDPKSINQALNLKFGGAELDWTLSHVALKDGGYAIAGNTLTASVQKIEAWVLRLDAKGKRVWKKRFQGKKWTEVNSIVVTGDGGFVIAGRVFGDNNLDAWIVRLDGTGNQIFEKSFGGTGDDWANAIDVLDDGSFVIAGHNGSSEISLGTGWVFCLDKNGSLIFEKIFGNQKEVRTASKIVALSDLGMVVVGEANKRASEQTKIWVLKLSSKGVVSFEKQIGGAHKNWAKGVAEDRGGGIAVTGTKQTNGDDGYDAYILKLSPRGEMIFEKIFGGPSNDWANDLISMPDGGFAIAGWSDRGGSEKIDAVIRRIDDQGNLIWQSRFGGKEVDRVYSIVLNAEDGLGAAGVTQSNGALGKDAWMITIPESQMPLNRLP